MGTPLVDGMKFYQNDRRTATAEHPRLRETHKALAPSE